MVAGSLMLLNVPMNRSPIASVEGEHFGEDWEIIAASQGRALIPVAGRNPIFGEINEAAYAERFENVRALIRERNASNKVWGFKDPASYDYIDQIRDELVNPHLIVVYRDMAAIAEREFALSGYPIADGLRTAMERYRAINEIVFSWRAPTLVVSYERSLRRRSVFARQLADFAGAAPSEEVLEAVKNFMAPMGGYRNLPDLARPGSAGDEKILDDGGEGR
jgi:hypothetical protein